MRVSLMRKLWKGDNTMLNVIKIKCKFCNEVKDASEFYKMKSALGWGKRCKPCYADNQREKNYGITPEEYNNMLEEQGGTCANKACNYGKDDDHKWHGSLSVDHCHETGVVRGLLCQWCNTAEGYLKSDPEVAQGLIDYMKKHNLKTK